GRRGRLALLPARRESDLTRHQPWDPVSTPSRFASAVVALLIPSLLSAQSPFDALHFRSIGPAATGGRIHDIQVDPRDLSTIYVASATGGIWKTTNKGTFWTPIFEGQPENSFGSLAISPANPNIVWAGSGEQQNRQSSSWGSGV